MDTMDEVPVFIAHVSKTFVAEDACIVDDDVDAAEVIKGSLYDLFAILHRVVVRYSDTAKLLDFVTNLLSGSAVLSST